MSPQMRKWLLVLLVSFAPMVTYRHAANIEDCVRYHATALQLLGLFLVAKGLIDTAKRFGKPTPYERAKAYLKSFGKKPQVHRTLQAGTGSYHSKSGAIRVFVDPANPTDQQRIEKLERLVGDLRADLTRTHDATTSELRRLGKQIESEAIERTKDHGETRSLLHDQIAGGLDEGYMGLVWVFCGTVFSGLTHEIAGWIS
jgi:hypothetical protein